MVRLLRRIVLASLLVGGAAFVVRRRRGHLPSGSTSSSDHASTAAWPPITTDEGQPVAQRHATGGRIGTDRTTDVHPGDEPLGDGSTGDDSTDDTGWAPPVDGRCPDGYPIKANDSSRIFHVPGGRFYERTIPDRCYAEADAATADGYRAAKA